MMLPRSPQLSVIIPIYNGKDTIGDCLGALFRSNFRDFEAIIVNDGSTDASDQIVSRFPCRMVWQDNAGPGPARNLGVRAARGQILFFLDADILVKPESLGRIISTFASRPDVGALFGSFGKETTPDNFVTVYKNLFHHYTHQTAEEAASTFCGGFGAIRRDVFEAVGGFHPPHRFLEDVEFGYRLHRAGVAVILQKDLQFTHCKNYTLWSLVRSDLYGRAIPWTRLMLSQRLFRNDLNTRTHNVLSVPCSLALAAGMLSVPVAVLRGHAVATIAGVVTLSVCFAWLNRRFLAFLAEEQGAGFALRAAPLLWLGYLYSAAGVGIGTYLHLIAPLAPFSLGDSSAEPIERPAEELVEKKSSTGVK